jgi:hypothetical protein
MPFSPQLDEFNTATQKQILPGIADNYFKGGPLMALLKSRFNRKWEGTQIQENFLYDAPKGGAYVKGGNFGNIVRKQTKTGLLFTPRYYQISTVEYLEDIEVELAGPMAAFSTVRQDLRESALTLSAILEIAAFRHGQSVGADDRTAEINGLEEAMTDGINATFSGATFTSYGGQLRSGVGTALNSPTGFISSPSQSQMSYRLLMHSYSSCVYNNMSPDRGITTNRGMAFIAETFLPHQMVDTTDPEIKWPGLKFQQATIVQSQYCPGSDGVNDANLGNYNASGETFWWLSLGPTGDDAHIRMWIAASPKFAFGFTGFKGAQDNNTLVGQTLFAGTMTNRMPRLHRALYGITN